MEGGAAVAVRLVLTTGYGAALLLTITCSVLVQ